MPNPEEVPQATAPTPPAPEQNPNAYVDERLYERDLIQPYLNRIAGKDQADTDRQRAMFVTVSRGIIADIRAENPNAVIGRTGEHNLKSIFEMAWDGLYPEKEPEPVVEPIAEPLVNPVPTGERAAPVRRTAGDIQPVEDGEELEEYVEQLGLKNYAKQREIHRLETKTIAGQGQNMSKLRDRMDESLRPKTN